MISTLLEDCYQSHSQLAVKRPVDRTAVLHVINGENYSGVERVQDLLAQRLVDHGFNLSFACLRPDQFDPMRESTVPLHRFEMRSRFDLSPAWRLARLVRQGGFRILHSHTPRSALVGQLAARLANVPLVHHVHGQTASERRVSAMVERFSVRRAVWVIAVSRTVRQYLIDQGFVEDRIAVVANGVPGPGQLPARRVCGDTWTIATMASFRPRKGTEVLLQALAKLRGRGLPVCLRVIGHFDSADYESSVRSLAYKLGVEQHVDWIGFTRDVAGELAKSDLLVLPSLLAEGMPIVILEAMAAGLPVIGTNVDGIRDLIQHSENGLLAEPGDDSSLAAQIGCVVRGEVDGDALRGRAFKQQREMYSDNSMATGVAEIYRNVLTKSLHATEQRS